MKTIKCFEVLGNTDTTEGRGPMKVVARFSTRKAAEEFVKSKIYARWCVMGYQSEKTDLTYIDEVDLIILDSIGEFEEQEKADIRARALAKLTKVERAALGV